MNWADLHFVRPLWLLAVIPLIGLAVALYYGQSRDTQWQRWIDSSLLTHLLDNQQQKTARWPLIALALAWVIAALAVAGPTWEKLPQPVVQKEQSLIIVWDLSPSMMAADIKPNRLIRSRYKLIDLLKSKREGEAALVVYGGEAHVVTPLTDDMDTIIAQLPALQPGLMPVSGSNTEMAVETALQLFSDSGVYSGDILLITDGVVAQARSTIKQLMAGSNHRLSILAVGTPAGAPIPFGDGFAKDESGNVIVDTVQPDALEKLAKQSAGKFSSLRSDNLDVKYLLQSNLSDATNPQFSSDENSSREFDQWLERGPFVALLLLPFAAFAFRRGWILPSLIILLSGATLSPEAYSLEWQDLWQTKDEQAYELLKNGDASSASQTFEDPRWNASAQYKSGNFEQAAKSFNGTEASDLYNKGNALAQSGKLPEAQAAYEQALAKQPDFDNAAHNLDVVKKLIEQQQNQPQDQQGGDDQQQPNDDQQESQNEQGDQGEQDQQDQSQANNEQSDSQNSDQNNQEETQENSSPNESQNENEQESEQQQAQSEPDNQDGDSQESNNPYQNTEPEQPSEEPQAQPQQSVASEDALSEEQQQALDQWLKQIPDDPSGLLRRKFEHQHRQRRQEYRTGQWELPSNDAASRL